jgi:hypothetical protein
MINDLMHFNPSHVFFWPRSSSFLEASMRRAAAQLLLAHGEATSHPLSDIRR